MEFIDIVYKFENKLNLINLILEFIKGNIFTILNSKYIIKKNGYILGKECFKWNLKRLKVF
jgi:hypothetical protein